jgi:ribosome-binding protein aMBF1 (putative translation factor)
MPLERSTATPGSGGQHPDLPLAQPQQDRRAPDGLQVLRDLGALGPDGLARAIRQARQRLGLDLEVLARRLGVRPEHLELCELGRIEPRPYLLYRLAGMLHDAEAADAPRPG